MSQTAAPAAVTDVAIVGATGYAGQELVRILARHPHVRLTAALGSATHGSAAETAGIGPDLGRRGDAVRGGQDVRPA